MHHEGTAKLTNPGASFDFPERHGRVISYFAQGRVAVCGVVARDLPNRPVRCIEPGPVPKIERRAPGRRGTGVYAIVTGRDHRAAWQGGLDGEWDRLGVHHPDVTTRKQEEARSVA